ncbi:protease modulator HflC [Burkholderiaceae bacterium DAT-1]|nr:protease modulator HflC [Burkholderiaceae bacterium DAT-1]
MQKLMSSLIGILFAGLLLSACVFTVDQRQYAVVFQMGEMVRVVKEPGLQFQLPFVQNVRYFDKRIMTLDGGMAQRFITAEKKSVLVDSYVKWQIVDVEQFYRSVGTSVKQANDRLMRTLNDALRAEFGKQTVQDVISGKRDDVMAMVRAVANADAGKIGVKIVDVRLKRVDFPEEISAAVFDRMVSERKTVAAQLRAEGMAEQTQIRAEADRKREVIIADAYQKAQEIIGEGDARASAIYADAFGKNPEFYAFYRSMDAYQKTFKSKSDVIVLDPSSAFLKYMRDPKAGGK